MPGSFPRNGVSLFALCSFIRLSSFYALTLTLRFNLRCLLVHYKVVESSRRLPYPQHRNYRRLSIVHSNSFGLAALPVASARWRQGFVHACSSHICCLNLTYCIDMSPQFCYARVQIWLFEQPETLFRGGIIMTISCHLRILLARVNVERVKHWKRALSLRGLACASDVAFYAFFDFYDERLQI